MKIKIYKDIRYMIFVITFVLYFIPRYLEYTAFVNYDYLSVIITACKAVSYVIALILFAIGMSKKRRINIAFIFVAITILIYFAYQSIARNINPLFVVLLFSLIYKEKYNEWYLNIVYKLSCVLYGITVVSSKLGLIEKRHW